jgi:hypothetical protein
MTQCALKLERRLNNPERPRLRRFRESLAELIPCEEDARIDLRNMQVRELLGSYINWRDRYVAPRPRRVVTWEGFLRHGSGQRHLAELRDLVKKIQAGDDLKPFLSDRIDRLGYVRPKARDNKKPRSVVEWGDKDYALNAFEAHHLHLRPRP